MAITATKAKIRKIFNEGLTTLDAIRPHVSCSDDTVTRALSEIRDELLEHTKLKTPEHLRKKSLEILKNQKESIESDLMEIENDLENEELKLKDKTALIKLKLDLMKEIRKVSGVDIHLKIIEKQQMNALDEDGGSQGSAKNKGVNIPKKTARIVEI